MSRRSTPERIDEARRAALHARLTDSGMPQERVEAWIARWEAEAARTGVPRDAGYWRAGWEWIASQRR